VEPSAVRRWSRVMIDRSLTVSCWSTHQSLTWSASVQCLNGSLYGLASTRATCTLHVHTRHAYTHTRTHTLPFSHTHGLHSQHSGSSLHFQSRNPRIECPINNRISRLKNIYTVTQLAQKSSPHKAP